MLAFARNRQNIESGFPLSREAHDSLNLHPHTQPCPFLFFFSPPVCVFLAGSFIAADFKMRGLSSLQGPPLITGEKKRKAMRFADTQFDLMVFFYPFFSSPTPF